MNASPAVASVIPYLRRITAKSVAELRGIKLLELPRPVKAQDLFDLVGTVFSSKVMPDRTGTKNDSVRFSGEFQACNIDTGEVYAESGICYIPVMEAVLHTTVQNAIAADPKARLALALRISIKPAPSDKPSATGYEFDVQRLIPTERKQDDPITQLKNMAKQHRAALLAPASTPVPVQTDVEDDAEPAKAAVGKHRR